MAICCPNFLKGFGINQLGPNTTKPKAISNEKTNHDLQDNLLTKGECSYYVHIVAQKFHILLSIYNSIEKSVCMHKDA